MFFQDDSVASENDDVLTRSKQDEQASGNNNRASVSSSTTDVAEDSKDDEFVREEDLIREEEKPQPVFDSEGKPLGMFPKAQANTMCVDVVAVYSPPTVETSEYIKAEDEDDEESSSIASSNSANSLASAAGQPSTSALDKDDSDNDNEDDDDNKDEKKTDKDKRNQLSIDDSKLSSATVTPNEPQSASSSASPSTAAIDSLSQTNDSTPITQAAATKSNRSPNRTNSINSPKLASPSPQSATKKQSSNSSQQSSFSFISQMGDDLLSDMTQKAKNFSVQQKTLLSNFMASQQVESPGANSNLFKQMLPNSLSSLKLSDNQMNASKRNDSISSGINSMLSTNSSGSKTTAAPSEQQQNQSDMNNENHQFLKEVLTGVMEGQGVGWLKIPRVKRLMEDENYRNFVLSRLNTSLDKKLVNDEEHIEDVKVSKAVFKGMAKILGCIVTGLEQTYANNGLGGMASAFQLVEIAHTHYCSSGSSSSTSQQAKSDGTMSPMSERSDSPFDSKENLSSLASNAHSSSIPSSQSIMGGLNGSQQGFQIQSTGNIVAQLGKSLALSFFLAFILLRAWVLLFQTTKNREFMDKLKA